MKNQRCTIKVFSLRTKKTKERKANKLKERETLRIKNTMR